jgi:hypothetical protein
MSGRGFLLLGKTLSAIYQIYTCLSISMVVIIVGTALSCEWRPINHSGS